MLISTTVIRAFTAQVLALARGSEDAHNTSNTNKSVSTSRTNAFVLLVLALMLVSTENLLL